MTTSMDATIARKTAIVGIGATEFSKDSGRTGKDIDGIAEFDACAEDLYRMAELSPANIDMACLYDHFSLWVLPQLEAFDFCDRDEAKHYIKDGHSKPQWFFTR